MTPLIKGLRNTTLSKAFIFNSIAAALIATIIVEIRYGMDSDKSTVGKFLNKMLGYFDPNPFDTEIHKMAYTFITGFFVSLIVYHLLYILTGFGDGMGAGKRFPYF